MDILKGLTSEQRSLVTHDKDYRKMPPGALIFNEGDPAQGLFTILSGGVEIYRTREEGSKDVIAVLGEGEVFGEIGLVVANRMRTASARTTKETTLFEIRGNPVDKLLQIVGHPAAGVMLQNLLVLLAKRLHRADSSADVVAPLAPHIHRDYQFDASKWIDQIGMSLPQGMFKKFMLDKKYTVGKVLCNEGDAPDGFYFIHTGKFAVRTKENGAATLQGNIKAPTIAGEVGFFSKEPRSATLECVEEALVTHFTAGEYEKLKAESPERAYMVLYAAVQVTACLLLERESS